MHKVDHSPTFNIQNERINLNLKMCQINKQSGTKWAEHSVSTKIWNQNGQLLTHLYTQHYVSDIITYYILCHICVQKFLYLVLYVKLLDTYLLLEAVTPK